MSSTNDNPIQTTDSGIPVESDQYSLTVGADGRAHAQAQRHGREPAYAKRKPHWDNYFGKGSDD
jgi:hypothetical protein